MLIYVISILLIQVFLDPTFPLQEAFLPLCIAHVSHPINASGSHVGVWKKNSAEGRAPETNIYHPGDKLAASKPGVHRFVCFKGQNCHSIENNEYTEPLLYAVPDTKVPQHY